MPEIIPAIIAKDFEELEKKIRTIEEFAAWAQIDVMDSVFTPPTTFSDPEKLRELKTHVKLEAHLMVSAPERVIDAWIASPVERILVHYESTSRENLHAILRKGEEKRKDVGIVLKYETPVSALDEFFVQHPSFRSVQLMGIAEIGYHGHPFEAGTFEKIEALRAQHPNGIIEIDGGVTIENVSDIAHVGVERIVAGSAIFKANDPQRAYDELKERARTR